MIFYFIILKKTKISIYVCRCVLLSTNTIPSSTIIHNDMYTFFGTVLVPYILTKTDGSRERERDRDRDGEIERDIER